MKTNKLGPSLKNSRTKQVG